MELTSQPAALPGNCIICHGVRELYIDTGLQMDWYGAVYVCNLCVLEMGRMIGMISDDQAEVLIQSNADLATTNYDLQTKLAGLSVLEAGINELVAAGYIGVVGTELGGDMVDPSDSEGSVPNADGADDGGSSGATSHLGTGEGTAPEQGDDEGMAVVRSDGGGDGGEFRIA